MLAKQTRLKTIQNAATQWTHIDASQRAGAFAYYAFFSLFPVLLLLVAVAAIFTNETWAQGTMLEALRKYLPGSQALDGFLMQTLEGVLKSGGKVGVAAMVTLVWSGAKFFTTMIVSIDAAWGDKSRHNWWQMPLKSILLLGVTGGMLLSAVVISISLGAIRHTSWMQYFPRGTISALRLLLPSLILFLSLALFYKIAPRRKIAFKEVWFAAFFTMFALRFGEWAFMLYLAKFSSFNAIYGAFGGIMVFLLWIYYSGCIFVYGACLSASRYQEKTTSETAKP